MGEASLPAMKMGTAFAKCTSTQWKAFGLSCGVGCARIGVFHKRNFQSTWVSSSSFTTSAGEAKRCFLHSSSYWSRKTLESNMSVPAALSSVWPGWAGAVTPARACPRSGVHARAVLHRWVSVTFCTLFEPGQIERKRGPLA
jgi:hypothetical protein